MLYTTYCEVQTARVEWVLDENEDLRSYEVIDLGLQQRRFFRAARLAKDSTKFLFLNFPKRSRESYLHKFLMGSLKGGLRVGERK